MLLPEFLKKHPKVYSAHLELWKELLMFPQTVLRQNRKYEKSFASMVSGKSLTAGFGNLTPKVGEAGLPNNNLPHTYISTACTELSK